MGKALYTNCNAWHERTYLYTAPSPYVVRNFSKMICSFLNWHQQEKVSDKTGVPGVSMLWLGALLGHSVIDISISRVIALSDREIYVFDSLRTMAMSTLILYWPALKINNPVLLMDPCLLLVVLRPINKSRSYWYNSTNTIKCLLPHWDKKCYTTRISHPDVKHWHKANQSWQ